MPSNRWASGTVAGVELKDISDERDLRVDVLDGESLSSELVASSIIALDLTVHTQLIQRVNKGVRFGIHIAQLPQERLEEIVAAMEAAMAAMNPFTVALSDTAGTDNFSVSAIIDYESNDGKPYKRGAIAANHVKDVIIRFISRA